MSNKDFWVSVLKRLQPTIKKAHFLTWFQSTAVVNIENGIMVVGVPTVYARDWITQKYNVKILQAAEEIDPSVKSIEYKVGSSFADEGGMGVDIKHLFAPEMEKKVRKARNLNEVTVVKNGSQTKVSSRILNGRYNLDNFVTGDDNRLPHAVCSAVAKDPGGHYNPLYIYGSSGFGKTHLLQAIGNQVLMDFPDMVLKYITAERFVTEVVDAIGKRQTRQFKEQYRKVDCFLIDDVQFFARKSTCQEEFFHTMNELYDANKQIVLTSDRPPSELQDLDDRLKSRFAMGMVTELIFPEFETRLAILQAKCIEFQTIIDPEVLSFIANNVHSSIRELEGVLRQVILGADLSQRVPTIRSAAEIIRRMNKAQEIIGYDLGARGIGRLVKNSMDVISIVAEYYNVSFDDVVGKDRHSNLMLPRQVSMYLIKHELGESYEKIGAGFGGRNHTTVMHACNKTAKSLRTNLRLVRDLNTIKREMGL